MHLTDSARVELKRRLINIVRFLDSPECSDAWQRQQLLEECDTITALLRPAGPPQSGPIVSHAQAA